MLKIINDCILPCMLKYAVSMVYKAVFKNLDESIFEKLFEKFVAGYHDGTGRSNLDYPRGQAGPKTADAMSLVNLLGHAVIAGHLATV